VLLALLAATASCGDDGAARLHDDALGALREGDLVAAETLAERAAARGSPEVAAASEVLLGCAAFARCERAELAFFGPAGGRPALDQAIAHARRALDLWRSAAASGATGPEARRNAERAVLKLAQLEGRRAESEAEPGVAPKARPAPPVRPEPEARPEPAPDQPRPARPDPELAELPRERVLSLLERLEAKEREKVRLRRARRQATGALADKDW
jgi:hypothetical protein